jgi:hypothetical protein
LATSCVTTPAHQSVNEGEAVLTLSHAILVIKWQPAHIVTIGVPQEPQSDEDLTRRPEMAELVLQAVGIVDREAEMHPSCSF